MASASVKSYDVVVLGASEDALMAVCLLSRLCPQKRIGLLSAEEAPVRSPFQIGNAFFYSFMNILELQASAVQSEIHAAICVDNIFINNNKTLFFSDLYSGRDDSLSIKELGVLLESDPDSTLRYTINTLLAKQGNRVAGGQTNQYPLASIVFDQRKLADLLVKVALANRVEVINDTVRQARVTSDRVEYLSLKNVGEISADLFIDTTKSRLLEPFLSGVKKEYQAERADLNASRMVICKASSVSFLMCREVLESYAKKSTSYGSLLVHEYYYNDSEKDDREVISTICKEHMCEPSSVSPKIQFSNSRIVDPWIGNVVFAGEAHCDLLDGYFSSMHLAGSAAIKIAELFPEQETINVLRKEFNRQINLEIEGNLILEAGLYAEVGTLLSRVDTPYLKLYNYKKDVFLHSGEIPMYEGELLSRNEWQDLFLMLGYNPPSRSPLHQNEVEILTKAKHAEEKLIEKLKCHASV